MWLITMEGVQRKHQVNMVNYYLTSTTVLSLTPALILRAGNHDRPFQAVNNNGGSQDSKRESQGEWCVLYKVAIHPTACCLRTCETNMKIAHIP